MGLLTRPGGQPTWLGQCIHLSTETETASQTKQSIKIMPFLSSRKSCEVTLTITLSKRYIPDVSA